MRTVDVVRSAVANTFRSKTRTILTILAIFIGAFTLTITTGLGTGINRYIDDTVAAIGAGDVMTVTKVAPDASGDGPRRYDPNAVAGGQSRFNQTPATAMAGADLSTLGAIGGVLSAQPNLAIHPDYIQVGDGTQYEVGVGAFVAGMQVQLAAGSQPDMSSGRLQVAIPASYVQPLGFAGPSDAIGKTAVIGLTNADKAATTVQATIVGVAEAGIGGSASNAVPNQALTQALFDAQSVGLSSSKKDSYASATIRFDPNAGAAQVTALKDRLTAAGFHGVTVADQLGTFKSVIDAIVLVLNAFAIIALLAASFGIVNTLFMSVQERTREIGLMKAMGMSSGKVFGLFSYEATFIGFLGSAIGVGIGMLAGTAISRAVATNLFANLPGLHLIAFDPLNVVTIILVVMGVAFLAGTLPAARASRNDPIESLRYE